MIPTSWRRQKAPCCWLFRDLIGHSFLSMALMYRYSASGAFL